MAWTGLTCQCPGLTRLYAQSPRITRSTACRTSCFPFAGTAAALSYNYYMYPLASFREYTQRYPSKITVVGFEFKKPRFTRLHRSALAFPLANFSYVGIDPSDDDDPDAAAKRNDGEQTRSFGPFSRDIYACRHPTLLEKKRVRNPFARAAPYYSKTATAYADASCPEITGLLDYCPRIGGKPFPGPLPWTSSA